MSAQYASPLTIQTQIDQINQNKFLTDAQKANAINSLQAQLKALGSYSGNTSGAQVDPTKIFQTQNLLTQALGARVSQITATPQFVAAKAQGASLNQLNQQLTQQGAYVTTPELNSFNNAIQGVPLTPVDQNNVTNLLNRLNAPVVSVQSTSTQDLYNFLSRSAALNPNPTPNVTNAQSSPAAGGGYQPPSNQYNVQVPPTYVNPIPNIINPLITPPSQVVPNIPNLPLSPPPSGTSSGGGYANPNLPSGSSPPVTGSTIPTIPFITDLGNWLNSMFKTSIDPTLLGGLVALLGVLVLLWLLGGVRPSGTSKKLVALPKLTR